MTTAIPHTKGPDLLRELSAFVGASNHFLDKNKSSIFVKKWMKEVDSLMKVDAIFGSMVMAKLSEAQGDIGQVDYWFGNANRLGLANHDIAANRLVSYCNLGYGSKALQVFRDHVDISHGNIGQTIWLTPGAGAFNHMKHLKEQAKRGNVELPESNLAVSQAVADLLAQSDVSDEICAQVIDVAGEVMRKHNLFWLGDTAKFVLDHESASVLMRFNVHATYEGASSMTSEAIELLIERDLDTVPFMIDFVGTHA